MTDQTDLFDFRPPPPEPTPQEINIARVKSAIEGAILRFYKAHPDAQFHNAELLAFTRNAVSPHIAPDSPARILRLLRQQGALDYKVVNRAQSLYEFRPVAVAA